MTTTLSAAITLQDWQQYLLGPEGVERQIRAELARQFVDAILNEDLIQIHTDRDISTNTLIARAQLKIIQE